MIDDILKVWPLLAVLLPAAGGGLIWMIRFEGRVDRLKERNAELEETVESNGGKIVELEKHVGQVEKKTEHLCRITTDQSGEVRFTSKTDCQGCRDDCKAGFHSIHIRLFAEIEKMNEKADKRAEKQEAYQLKVAETLSDVRSFMRTTSALMPDLLKRGGYNIFNNAGGRPKEDDD